MKEKNSYTARFLKAATALLLIVLTAALCSMTAIAQSEQQAENIARYCRMSATSYEGQYEYLTNGYCSSAFRVTGYGEQSLSIDLNGKEAAAMYIKWGKFAPEWTLEVTLADGTITRTQQGLEGFVQEYVQLPEGAQKLVMITPDGRSDPLQIVELEIYSRGTLPDSVHIWNPSPTTAEVMFIATHQDDEVLYFGGAIPYYAGERAYDSVVVYTAYDNYLRLHEALEGLWVCGERQHPVFMKYPDSYSMSIDGARNVWNEEKVILSLTEQIVKHRPQVVITQDENGEYGHGQHILTVYCVKRALERAEDEDYLFENLPGMEPWTVKKCYLHLYPRNVISMPWDRLTMDSFGGRSTYQAARDAFNCHKSQKKYKEYSVSFTEYDCRRFGLYWTRVDEDVEKNDFFENITLRYQHAQPPDSAVTGYIEQIQWAKGWLYRRTDITGQLGEYLRYCVVDGVEGWYAADYTGSLIEPITGVIIAKDEPIPDISLYSNLTMISSSPQLFEYSDGDTVNGLILRYCAVGDGTADFYIAGMDGQLTKPLTRVEVPYSTFAELLHRVENIRATDVVLIAVCGLMVCSSIALCIAVFNLSSKKRMNRRRRRR